MPSLTQSNSAIIFLKSWLHFINNSVACFTVIWNSYTSNSNLGFCITMYNRFTWILSLCNSIKRFWFYSSGVITDSNIFTLWFLFILSNVPLNFIPSSWVNWSTTMPGLLYVFSVTSYAFDILLFDCLLLDLVDWGTESAADWSRVNGLVLLRSSEVLKGNLLCLVLELLRFGKTFSIVLGFIYGGISSFVDSLCNFCSLSSSPTSLLFLSKKFMR